MQATKIRKWPFPFSRIRFSTENTFYGGIVLYFCTYSVYTVQDKLSKNSLKGDNGKKIKHSDTGAL